MKNLLPILALLLLVGCTSELDRCIEANKRYDWFTIIADGSITFEPNSKYNQCLIERADKKLYEQGEFLEAYKPAMADCFLKHGKEQHKRHLKKQKEKAREICNSQGIY